MRPFRMLELGGCRPALDSSPGVVDSRAWLRSDLTVFDLGCLYAQ